MKKLVVFLILLNIVFVCLYVYDKINAPKTAFILIQDVFNKFELKKDYEKKLTDTRNSRQKLIENMETELKILGKKIESEGGKNKDDVNVFTVKREEYFSKKKIAHHDENA